MSIQTNLDSGQNGTVAVKHVFIHVRVVYHMLITAMDRNIKMVLIEYGGPGPGKDSGRNKQGNNYES